MIKGKRFRITLPADTFVGSSDYPAFIDENGVAHRLPGYKDGSSPFYHGRCYNDVARTVTMGTANNGDMMLIIRTEVAQGAPASERAGAIAAVEPCSNWMSWPDQLNPYW